MKRSSLSTGWERKLELLHELSDVLDQFLVDDGIIAPHPQFSPSPTSGYRVLEHAYAEIIQGLRDELKGAVPIWDQIHLSHSTASSWTDIPLDTWDEMLQLRDEGTSMEARSERSISRRCMVALASWWPLLSSADEYAEEADFFRRVLGQEAGVQAPGACSNWAAAEATTLHF